MKNLIMSGVIVFLVALLAPQTARSQGTIYVSSLGQPSTGSAAVASDSWLAAQFFTGNNPGGYALDYVQLAMTPASGAPNGFTVMLYSAGSGRLGQAPASNLGSLSGSSTDPVTGGIYSYNASGLILSPSTYYFIVLTAGTAVASGAYAWSYDNSPRSTSGGWSGPDALFTSSDGSTLSWFPTPPDPQFNLSATPTPEPNSLYLLGLPGLLFFAWRRWRAKAPAR